MRWRLLFVAAAMLVGLAAPAAAAELDEVADALRTEGFYVEAGSGSEVGLLDAIAEAGGQVGLASFAEDLGDATVLAEDLAGRSGVPTVIVLTPFEIGAYSDVYSSSQLSEGIDAAFDAFDRSLAEGFEIFVRSLEGSVGTTASNGASSAFPTGTVVLWVLVGGGIFLWWRSRSRSKKAALRRVDEARGEVNEQIADISNEILELSDRITVSDNQPARDSFQEATATFNRVQKSLEDASTVAALEDVSDDLDDTRYLLDVAEAQLDGRPIPEKPAEERMRCFFDPRHPRATETATLDTRAGRRSVAVCEADAAKLRRGERPNLRGIDVDGRRMPAPRAPRSYGGSGFDWLDVFSVIVGGSRAMDFDLGGRPRIPQRRTVYPRRPGRTSRTSRGSSVVPGPRSARSAGRSSSSARRSGSGGRASRSRRSSGSGGRARRRR